MEIKDIPQDVWFVWTTEQTRYVGLETYQKCKDIMKRYPEWFPWEAKYDSIPQEVHDAYFKEKNPDWGKPFKCNGSGKGILELIREREENTVNIIQKHLSISEIFEEFFKQEEENHKRDMEQFKKEKKLWDKHYRKYKIEYRK